MEDLIGHVILFVGLDAATARLAAGNVLNFLIHLHPNGPAVELIRKWPGAEAAMADAAAAPQKKRGFVGGVMSGIGGVMGGATGDALAMSARLIGLGMTQNQLQRFTRQFFLAAERAIGREKTKEMTDPIPGLSRFVWPEG